MLCSNVASSVTSFSLRPVTEATGLEAKTIHRLLKLDPKTGGFKRGEDHPFDCDLLVVDETSMVDVMLMQALLMAVRKSKPALTVDGMNFQAGGAWTASLQFQGRSSLSLEARCPRASWSIVYAR